VHAAFSHRAVASTAPPPLSCSWLRELRKGEGIHSPFSTQPVSVGIARIREEEREKEGQQPRAQDVWRVEEGGVPQVPGAKWGD
jgi:hypothetical protein